MVPLRHDIALEHYLEKQRACRVSTVSRIPRAPRSADACRRTRWARFFLALAPFSSQRAGDQTDSVRADFPKQVLRSPHPAAASQQLIRTSP
jgi:hypothetical protein